VLLCADTLKAKPKLQKPNNNSELSNAFILLPPPASSHHAISKQLLLFMQMHCGSNPNVNSDQTKCESTLRVLRLLQYDL